MLAVAEGDRREWWRQALRHERDEFLAAARAADLDADVPSCPGWTVRRLVSHVGRVHRHAIAGVQDGTAEPPALGAKPPDDTRLLAWFGAGVDRLLEVMTDAEPQLADFWPRRMAHETTIHRFDAELAAYAKGGSFDPAFAADGVGEVVESLLGMRADEEPLASARGDVLVDCTDTGHRWLVALEPGAVRTELVENMMLHLMLAVWLDGGGYSFSETARVGAVRTELVEKPPRRFDARVAGPAADLYLVLWGRLPIDPAEPGRSRRQRVEISGDRSLAALVRTS